MFFSLSFLRKLWIIFGFLGVSLEGHCLLESSEVRPNSLSCHSESILKKPFFKITPQKPLEEATPQIFVYSQSHQRSFESPGSKQGKSEGQSPQKRMPWKTDGTKKTAPQLKALPGFARAEVFGSKQKPWAEVGVALWMVEMGRKLRFLVAFIFMVLGLLMGFNGFDSDFDSVYKRLHIPLLDFSGMKTSCCRSLSQRLILGVHYVTVQVLTNSLMIFFVWCPGYDMPLEIMGYMFFFRGS